MRYAAVVDRLRSFNTEQFTLLTQLADRVQSDRMEINRLGYADRRAYPNPRFWRLAGEAGVEAVIGVDAHHPRDLTDTASIIGCLRLAAENGLRLVTELL